MQELVYVNIVDGDNQHGYFCSFDKMESEMERYGELGIMAYYVPLESDDVVNILNDYKNGKELPF